MAIRGSGSCCIPPYLTDTTKTSKSTSATKSVFAWPNAAGIRLGSGAEKPTAFSKHRLVLVYSKAVFVVPDFSFTPSKASFRLCVFVGFLSPSRSFCLVLIVLYSFTKKKGLFLSSNHRLIDFCRRRCTEKCRPSTECRRPSTETSRSSTVYPHARQRGVILFCRRQCTEMANDFCRRSCTEVHDKNDRQKRVAFHSLSMSVGTLCAAVSSRRFMTRTVPSLPS